MTQTSCASTPLDVWPALPTDKLRLHENNAEIKVIDKETGESALIGTYNISIPFAIIPTHPFRRPPWATYAKCFAVYEADGCFTWFASGWSRYDGYASSEPQTMRVQRFAKDVLGLENFSKDGASHAEVQAFMHWMENKYHGAKQRRAFHCWISFDWICATCQTFFNKVSLKYPDINIKITRGDHETVHFGMIGRIGEALRAVRLAADKS